MRAHSLGRQPIHFLRLQRDQKPRQRRARRNRPGLRRTQFALAIAQHFRQLRPQRRLVGRQVAPRHHGGPRRLREISAAGGVRSGAARLRRFQKQFDGVRGMTHRARLVPHGESTRAGPLTGSVRPNDAGRREQNIAGMLIERLAWIQLQPTPAQPAHQQAAAAAGELTQRPNVAARQVPLADTDHVSRRQRLNNPIRRYVPTRHGVLRHGGRPLLLRRQDADCSGRLGAARRPADGIDHQSPGVGGSDGFAVGIAGVSERDDGAFLPSGGGDHRRDGIARHSRRDDRKGRFAEHQQRPGYAGRGDFRYPAEEFREVAGGERGCAGRLARSDLGKDGCEHRGK